MISIGLVLPRGQKSTCEFLAVVGNQLDDCEGGLVQRILETASAAVLPS